MTKTVKIRTCAFALAAALSALGAFFRIRAVNQSGAILPYGGMEYPQLALLIVCIGAAVCFGIFALLLNKSPIKGGRAPLIHTFLYALSAVGLLCGGALYFFEKGLELSFSVIALGAFAAISGIMLLISMGKNSQVGKIARLFPVFYTCFFLLSIYSHNAKNPVVQSFAFEITLLMFLVLALFLIASFDFETRKEGLALWACLVAFFMVCTEIITYAFCPEAVLSVPGINLKEIVIIAALGLYCGAGVFSFHHVDTEKKEEAEETFKKDFDIPLND